MGWSMIGFGLVIGGVLLCASCSAENILVTEHSCNSYSVDASSTGTHMIYNGESPMGGSCYFTFHNIAVFEKTLCVKPVSLKLDCSTTIEYHRHYIDNNDFSKQMSCNSLSYDEWCGPKRTSRLYVLIKKTWSVPTDIHIDLHVYLKTFSDDKEDNIWSISSDNIWSISSNATSTMNVPVIVCATVFPILILLTTVIIVVYCKQVRSRQSASRPLYAFQITSTHSQGNTFPLHQMAATHPSVQVGYQPVPQTMPTQIPPGYHLHPMQSAVPVQTQRDSSEPGVRPIHVGTTPGHLSQNTQESRRSPRHSPTPHTDLDGPPPSYESVVNQ